MAPDWRTTDSASAWTHSFVCSRSTLITRSRIFGPHFIGGSKFKHESNSSLWLPHDTAFRQPKSPSSSESTRPLSRG